MNIQLHTKDNRLVHLMDLATDAGPIPRAGETITIETRKYLVIDVVYNIAEKSITPSIHVRDIGTEKPSDARKAMLQERGWQ